MSARVYRQTVPLDFGDADMAGILYFPRLFHVCHVVMEGFVNETLGITYERFLNDRNLGFPTVHTEADYHRPLPYGRDLEVAMTVRRMGKKSLDFRWCVRQAGDDGDRAEARSTVVCVDMKKFESVPLPDDVRSAFTPWLEVE